VTFSLPGTLQEVLILLLARACSGSAARDADCLASAAIGLPLANSLSARVPQEVQQRLAVPSSAPCDKAAEKAEDRRLVAAANFSDEQKRVLVALHTALYTNLGRLQRRRELLTVELQVSSSLSGLHLAIQALRSDPLQICRRGELDQSLCHMSSRPDECSC
jgi:hypothetical protein